MAIKKNELYSSLWASCDKLRGGMDASQYKDYILTLLFVKYVTDKFKGVKYATAKRFQLPEEVQPWKGIKEAGSYGFICPTLEKDKPKKYILILKVI